MIKEIHDLSKEEGKAHVIKYGRFNDFPPNWHEIDAKAYSRADYFTYGAWLSEYRQMLPPTRDKVMVAARLEFLRDGTGYAVVNDWHEQTIKYFKFGCDHQWGDPTEELKKRGIKLAMFDNASYCVKCGHLAIHDSSD